MMSSQLVRVPSIRTHQCPIPFLLHRLHRHDLLADPPARDPHLFQDFFLLLDTLLSLLGRLLDPRQTPTAPTRPLVRDDSFALLAPIRTRRGFRLGQVYRCRATALLKPERVEQRPVLGNDLLPLELAEVSVRARARALTSRCR